MEHSFTFVASHSADLTVGFEVNGGLSGEDSVEWIHGWGVGKKPSFRGRVIKSRFGKYPN